MVEPLDAADHPSWQAFLQQREVAHKILADQDNPKAGDRIRSVVDITMDAASELIMEINVLAANGNDIEAISIDGAGFNGALLRELEDPEDLAMDVFTPPPKARETKIFTSDDFVEDAGQGEEDEQPAVLTCPAGQTTR
jgi:hypothetical protein